jgi:hypothetical protein
MCNNGKNGVVNALYKKKVVVMIGGILVNVSPY